MIPFLHLFADQTFHTLADEAELQKQIAQMLTDAGFAFEREVLLSEGNRIDFLVGNVGLEVKIKGSRTEVLRQLHRYAQHPSIGQLVLATTRWSHARMPPFLTGKSLTILPLYGGSL